MIGEKIADLAYKTTGRRVISDTEHGPRMEVSIEQTGKFLGIDVVDYGTYDAVMNDAGMLEGKGQGITMTKDGDSLTWTATALGRLTGKGQSVQWRGSIHYHTKSQKLAKANSCCYVFECDIDETGKSGQVRVHEWK